MLAAGAGYEIGQTYYSIHQGHLADAPFSGASATSNSTSSGEDAAEVGQRRIDDAALPALLEKALAAPWKERREHDLYEIAERLTGTQFSAAVDLLCQEKNRELAGELLAYWLEKDFASARAYIARTPLSELSKGLLPTYTWARANPQDFSRWVGSLTAEDREALGADVFSNLTSTLAEIDGPAAVRIYTEGAGTRLPEGVATALRFWARHDPSSAAATALSLPPSSAKDDAIEGIITIWSQDDPESARSFLAKIQDRQLHDKVVIDQCEQMLDTNPAGAADALAQLNPSSLSVQNVFKRTLSEWVGKDAQAALDWAGNLSGAPGQGYALGEIIGQIALKDPDQAARIYAEERNAGLAPDVTIAGSAIALSLAKQRGIAAANTFFQSLPPDEEDKAFQVACRSILENIGYSIAPDQILQLPEGPYRNQWLQTMTESYMKGNSWKAVSQFLGRISDTTERNSLSILVANTAIMSDPDTAVAIFSSIPNGHARLLDAAAKWLNSANLANRPNAEGWVLSTSAISDQERNALLEKLPSATSR